MTLGIYGSGGVGRETLELANLLDQWEEIIFIDDTNNRVFFRGIKTIPFTQFTKEYEPESAEVIIAIGEPLVRDTLYCKVKRFGYSFANIIHPKSHISSSAKLGQGVLIQENVYIGCDVVLSDNVCVEPDVFVGHDCILKENCVLASHTALGGKVTVGKSVFVGLNASVRQHVQIGSSSIVGMGSVVIDNIPDDAVVGGNPAKILRIEKGCKVFR